MERRQITAKTLQNIEIRECFIVRRPVKWPSGAWLRQGKLAKTGFFADFPFTWARCFAYDEGAFEGQWPRLPMIAPAGRPSFARPGSGNATFLNDEDWEDRQKMADRMTQTQLVKELAEGAGVANKVAKAMLESYAAIAVRETKKNGVFVLPGVGRLVRVERKARVGRNPATGQEIKIPAKKVVKFRVAKSVKDSIVPPKKK